MNNKDKHSRQQGLIMGENGLYVEPDFLLEKKSEYAAKMEK
jgi:hypothetical protein